MRRRRGPGLLMTAAVVGTASHVGAKSAQKSQAAGADQAEMAGKAAAYDEMQQQQAIEAAAAAAVAAQSVPAPPPPAGGEDSVAQLQQLAELHTQGILTDEEFAAKKQQILGI